MNRYTATFRELADKNEAAFIPFAVAGDPDIALSESIIKTYIDSGADILEIGYPFSDPVADGPVNQRSAQRAIASGITPARFFKLIKAIRSYDSRIPIGLLLYSNTVHHKGYVEFCNSAANAGIDSLLVADMPPEEHEELSSAMNDSGLSRVFIVSELTPDDRIKYISGQTDAFIYVVSRLGITGTGNTLSSGIKPLLSRISAVSDKPLAVGFGISTPEHVREVISAGADAAIVGSALVKLTEGKYQSTEALLKRIARNISQYKKATLHCT